MKHLLLKIIYYFVYLNYNLSKKICLFFEEWEHALMTKRLLLLDEK